MKRLRWILLATIFMLTGCAGSLLSGAGPSIGSIVRESDESAYDLVDLSALTIAPYMRARQHELTNTVSPTDLPATRLVPGDVLKVMIGDDSGAEKVIFAPLAAGGTIFENVRITSSGEISLPYLGRTKVSGMSLNEVENTIRQGVLRKLGAAQADSGLIVYVELASDLSSSVLVAGAVKSPGRFTALQGPLTILDAINRAGGPVMEPHLARVVIRTGSEVDSYSYEEILSGGNKLVPPNSEIVLERARQRFVAMGAVGQPGLHDLPSANPSLLEVLGTAGGLKEVASDASGVFVFRLSDESEGVEPKATVFRLNMRNPESIFLARQFLVHPEDAIYVTNAAVYEWQKIISPIVQVLVLGRTVNNGF